MCAKSQQKLYCERSYTSYSPFRTTLSQLRKVIQTEKKCDALQILDQLYRNSMSCKLL